VGSIAGRRLNPVGEKKENAQLVEQIKKVFAANKSRYGSPRVTRELRRQGLQCGEKRIARLMRQNKLVARAKKASRPRITVAGSSAAPNLIKGLEPTGVNQIWVSDITYLATLEGWLYFGGHSGCVQEAFFSTLKSECLPATQGL
jgi:putative transposase